METENFFGRYRECIIQGINKAIIMDGAEERMNIEQGIQIWIEKIKQIRDETKGLIFFCGNGASATMAEHMSHDWFQNAEVNTTTCAETAHITAISNDLCYEEVFSYRINRILSENDMLVTISSSGNSPNIIRALEAGRRKGAFLVTLSGMGESNRSLQLGDLNFYVPLASYGLVECAHALILHGALDLFLEKYMGGMH